MSGIADLLASLPEEERIILSLHYLKGLSEKDIAKKSQNIGAKEGTPSSNQVKKERKGSDDENVNAKLDHIKKEREEKEELVRAKKEQDAAREQRVKAGLQRQVFQKVLLVICTPWRLQRLTLDPL